MNTWLTPLSSLTPEQVQAVELDPGRHRVLIGSPGTGKTLILLHRAHRLRQAWGTPPERFRIFVYNSVLKNYITAALNFLQLPEDSVTYIDPWCLDYYSKFISKRIPRKADSKKTDYLAVRGAVARHVWANPPKEPWYDFVMVDEGQDLEPELYGVFRALSKHVTVGMDGKQRIYEHGSTEHQVLDKLGLRRGDRKLLGAFRCNPFVTRIAAQCISDERDRALFLEQNRAPQTLKQTPMLYLASDPEDEVRQLIDAVSTRLSVGASVAVLLPNRRVRFELAEASQAAGIQVEVQPRRPNEQNPLFPKPDFDTDRPKLLSYHSGKGLTFDSVFLPRLTSKYFRVYPSDVARHLVFVSVSRATQWVYLSAVSGRELPLVRELMRLEDEHVLTVRRATTPPNASANEVEDRLLEDEADEDDVSPEDFLSL